MLFSSIITVLTASAAVVAAPVGQRSLPVGDVVDAVPVDAGVSAANGDTTVHVTSDLLPGTSVDVTGPSVDGVDLSGLNPLTGTVEKIAGSNGKRAVDVDLGGTSLSLDKKRAVDVDLGGTSLSLDKKRAVDVDLGGTSLSLDKKRAVDVDLGGTSLSLDKRAALPVGDVVDAVPVDAGVSAANGDTTVHVTSDVLPGTSVDVTGPSIDGVNLSGLNPVTGAVEHIAGSQKKRAIGDVVDTVPVDASVSAANSDTTVHVTSDLLPGTSVDVTGPSVDGVDLSGLNGATGAVEGLVGKKRSLTVEEPIRAIY